jgi:hypothetical protein
MWNEKNRSSTKRLIVSVGGNPNTMKKVKFRVKRINPAWNFCLALIQECEPSEVLLVPIHGGPSALEHPCEREGSDYEK